MKRQIVETELAAVVVRHFQDLGAEVYQEVACGSRASESILSTSCDGALLKSAFDQVADSITVEETRFQLHGVLLYFSGRTLEAVATDGHRMAIRRIPTALSSSRREKWFVSAAAATQIRALRCDAEIRIGSDERHHYFRAGDREVVERVISVNFPNYRAVIQEDLAPALEIRRDEFLSALARVRHATHPRTKAMRLDFSRGALSVVAMNPEIGEARESLAIDYTGPATYVGLNIDYVSQALWRITTPTVRLSMKDEHSQVTLQPSEVRGEQLYVVMPMRLAWQQPKEEPGDTTT